MGVNLRSEAGMQSGRRIPTISRVGGSEGSRTRATIDVAVGVAAAVRSDADLDVRGGGRRAGAAGEGVEDKDGAFAGRDEQGLEAGGEAPGGIGAVLPPAVGAATT